MAKFKEKQIEQNVNSSRKIALWLDKNTDKLIWVYVALAGVFSLLLFDLKIGVGGDDSAYIKRAFDLITEGRFPTYQGPLYPIVLSFFVALFGISIPILKSLSLVFMLVGIYFFLAAFRKHTSPFVFNFVGLTTSINSMLLFYAGQTYVEAFFFMLLSINVYYFFKLMIDVDDAFPNKKNWKIFVSIGILMFLLSLSKTVGIAFVIGVAAFLLQQKKWKQLVGILSVSAILNLLWSLQKRLFWDIGRVQFSEQGSAMMLKNPYVPSEGKEDLWGFVVRFGENMNIYLSKHFYAFFNLRDVVSEPNVLLTFVIVFVSVGALGLVWKSSKHMVLIAFTMAAMLCVTFIALQTVWDTPRLVVPFVPFIAMFVFNALYNIETKTISKLFKVLITMVLVVLLLSTFNKSIQEQKREKAGIQAYMKGQKLKGYTPDWVNFIKMSQWAAKNPPDSVQIACRKPSISFLYTGRKFFGIFRIPMHEEIAFFSELKEQNVSFVVLDEQKFSKMKIPSELLIHWKRNLLAFYAGSLGKSDRAESRFYGVYKVDTDKAKQLYSMLQKRNVQFEDSEVLLNGLDKHKLTMMIIKPDELLDQLKGRNSRYVIMANLRKYEKQKTPYTINTIRRYIFYLQYKYPNILRQVSEVGRDEKAFLFEVLYDDKSAL